MSGEDKKGPDVPPMGIGSEAWDLALGTLMTQLREKYKTEELEKLRIELVVQMHLNYQIICNDHLQGALDLFYTGRIDEPTFMKTANMWGERMKESPTQHFDTVDSIINYALNNPFTRVR